MSQSKGVSCRSKIKKKFQGANSLFAIAKLIAAKKEKCKRFGVQVKSCCGFDPITLSHHHALT